MKQYVEVIFKDGFKLLLPHGGFTLSLDKSGTNATLEVQGRHYELGGIKEYEEAKKVLQEAIPTSPLHGLFGPIE